MNVTPTCLAKVGLEMWRMGAQELVDGIKVRDHW